MKRSIVVAVALGLFASRAQARPNVDARANAAVLKFCADNAATYKADIAYSKQRDTPPVPEPPELDPPCQACSAPAPTQPSDADAAAAKFISDAETPEADMASYLFARTRDLAILESQRPTLSTAAVRCLNAFSATDADDAAVALLSRLYKKKAEPMAKAYGTDGKRSYAGIKFLLETERLLHLADGMPASGAELPNSATVDAYVVKWTQATIRQGKDRIIDGKQFNLCPTYVGLFRDLTLAGGPNDPSDTQTIADLLQQFDKLLRFKVQLDLHAAGKADDGSTFDLVWHGEATLHLAIGANKCYTPEIVPDANLDVTVKSFSMVDARGNHVDYVSPNHFKLPISDVQLSLCDASPKLSLTFSGLGPDEILKVTASGRSGTTKSKILTEMLGAVAGYKQAESGDVAARMDQIQDTAQKIRDLVRAHQNDKSWLTSPDGIKAIAAIQTGGASAAASAAPGSFSMTMKWTNGTATVVDEDQSIAAGGLFTDTVKVQVQQQPGG